MICPNCNKILHGFMDHFRCHKCRFGFSNNEIALYYSIYLKTNSLYYYLISNANEMYTRIYKTNDNGTTFNKLLDIPKYFALNNYSDINQYINLVNRLLNIKAFI